ncbi:MAG: hypothetical protein ACRDTD_06885 [Pseudonocardiaceae bacterium]
MVTGSRRGEISALRWRHVDFDRGFLLVQRENAQPKSGIKEKETKTGQQRRVALDPETLALLAEHRKRCDSAAPTLTVRSAMTGRHSAIADPGHPLPASPRVLWSGMVGPYARRGRE